MFWECFIFRSLCTRFFRHVMSILVAVLVYLSLVTERFARVYLETTTRKSNYYFIHRAAAVARTTGDRP